MKPDFKRLDDVDLEVVNVKLTETDIKEISAFIQEHKRKEKLKANRRRQRKLSHPASLRLIRHCSMGYRKKSVCSNGVKPVR